MSLLPGKSHDLNQLDDGEEEKLDTQEGMNNEEDSDDTEEGFNIWATKSLPHSQIDVLKVEDKIVYNLYPIIQSWGKTLFVSVKTGDGISRRFICSFSKGGGGSAAREADSFENILNAAYDNGMKRRPVLLTIQVQSINTLLLRELSKERTSHDLQISF